jgi:hypothetical protein
MSKSIILPLDIWADLHCQLAKDNPSSVILIRERMKAVLGFTVRRHREWIMDPGYDGYGNYKETIHLDFYDEPKRIFFLLKYGDYLNKSQFSEQII